jgi:hypothetical protein
MPVPQGAACRHSCCALLRAGVGAFRGEKKPKSKKLKRRKLKFGTLRDRIVEVDPNWWRPMTEEEMEKEGWFNDLDI